MIDFTDTNKRDEALEQLSSVLRGVAASTRIYIEETSTLIQLRAEFDSLWDGLPIVRGGTNVLNSESRMLWMAMRAAGMDRENDQTYDNGGGRYIHFGEGEAYFLPFGDNADTLCIEYRAAISALKHR